MGATARLTTSAPPPRHQGAASCQCGTARGARVVPWANRAGGRAHWRSAAQRQGRVRPDRKNQQFPDSTISSSLIVQVIVQVLRY